MLQKDRSTTTSSRSATSKSSAQPTGLDTPVQFVKGVGPRLGMIFNQRDIFTVRDLLTFFPRAYEDRTRMAQASQLKEGQSATIALTVVGQRKIPLRARGRVMLEVRCTDGLNPVNLKYFYIPRGIEAKFTAGTKLVVTGQVKNYQGRPEIVHPEISWGSAPPPNNAQSPATLESPEKSDELDFGRVVPIYTEIDGVPSKTLRKILNEAISKYSNLLTEDIPEALLIKNKLPALAQAVRAIHFPQTSSPPATERPFGEGTANDAAEQEIARLLAFNTPAHHRLIYEEFFKFEWLVLRNRLNAEKEFALALTDSRSSVASLRKFLPFQLTGDQNRALTDILDDLSQVHPMNRLVQGDVGSGKTAVAYLSAGAVIAEGGQAVLMAPTEILADQHFKNAVRLFGEHLKVGLLVGRSTASERTRLLARLKGGEPMLVIGTHALLEDPVEFKNLLLVMIDEQHRFGVDQRRILRLKGTREAEVTLAGGRLVKRLVHPHTLVLTATPIPRTLALTAYGDLAVSNIQEMPPGRSPIRTEIFWGDAHHKAYQKIRSEIQSGHQAYLIYPLVNESEAEGFTHLKSAVLEIERLQVEVFPEFKLGLLHGQMKADEKADVMAKFARNEIQILVSTTVVEVGVDVPNATVMAIEHAERFGLSQLHQLRGRVGRGKAQSHCFLFAPRKTGEMTALRLEVLEETTDGFKIAEADLEIRGPGEFLGTKQAGNLPFKLAHLVRDKEWLFKAREDATALLSQDPDLLQVSQAPLRTYLIREGRLQSDLLKTS